MGAYHHAAEAGARDPLASCAATTPGSAHFIPTGILVVPSCTQNRPHYKKTFHTTLAGTLAAVFSSILPSVWATRREPAGSEAFSA